MTIEQFNIIVGFLQNYEFYLVCITLGVCIHAGFTLYCAIFRD